MDCRGRTRQWSAFDDKVLRTLHGNGWSQHAIAHFMCCGSLAIRDRARALGLAFRSSHRWTAQEDAVLRAHYADEPGAVVAARLGLPRSAVFQRAAKLGLGKSMAFYASDRSGRMQRGRRDPRMCATQFPKGHVPANKGLRRPGWAPGRMAETQFKQGRAASEARNYRPIGTEKIDRKRQVLMRKVTDDPAIYPVARWRPVHVLVWEAARGHVPPDHIVIFRPGCKTFVSTEITVDKLELVSLAENMRRNTIHARYPSDVVQVIQLKSALKRKINNRSKQA